MSVPVLGLESLWQCRHGALGLGAAVQSVRMLHAQASLQQHVSAYDRLVNDLKCNPVQLRWQTPTMHPSWRA